MAGARPGAPRGTHNVVDDDPAPVSEWLPRSPRRSGRSRRGAPTWIGGWPEAKSAVLLTTRSAEHRTQRRSASWVAARAHPSWREGFLVVLWLAGTWGRDRAASCHLPRALRSAHEWCARGGASPPPDRAPPRRRGSGPHACRGSACRGPRASWSARPPTRRRSRPRPGSPRPDPARHRRAWPARQELIWPIRGSRR